MIDANGERHEFYIPQKNLPLSKFLQASTHWLKNSNQINIKEYQLREVQEFFEFMATGYLPSLTEENAMILLHIANYFDAPKLIDHCLDFIKKNGTFDVIPNLLEMGLETNNRKLIDCCQDMVDNFTKGPRIRPLDLREMSNILGIPLKPSDEPEKPINPFRKLIAELLVKGVETNQKEMIWFAVQNGMSKRREFPLPIELIENLASSPVTNDKVSHKQLEKGLTAATCKALIIELTELFPFDITFKKELGQMDLHFLPPKELPLTILSNYVPLTLNITREVTKNEYFEFINKVMSQKIQVNVKMPTKWKKTNRF